MLSRRVRSIGLSTTLRIVAQADEMRARGEDVVDFSAGQPDFPTPDAAKAAGQRAIAENRTRYTANAGIRELREAVAASIERERGVHYAADEILISPGAKASLYLAFLALVDPGDEVLVPQPYWVSYPEQIRLAGGEPVFVPCREERGFRLELGALERARTARTRALVLNYPCNPTGACPDGDELGAIAEFCLRHDLWVVADEIYARLLYGGRRFACIAALGAAIRSRTVVVDGVSKTYSMTGWRIGWAAGPREVIAGMDRTQSHSTSNATSVAQWASLAALRECADEVTRRCAEFEGRRDEMLRGLGAIEGLRCAVPDGAFYAFPNVTGVLGRAPQVDTPAALARHLLESARVAVVPGEAFGSAEHLRLSFALSLEGIREGIGRVSRALAALG